MTQILHLGVVDIAYQREVSRRPIRKGARKGSRWRKSDLIGGGVTTTGDVAEILEARYHVIEIYFQTHEEKILGDIEDSVVGMIENLQAGAPARNYPYDAAAAKIEEGFHDFISNREMDSLGYPGVPTKAALAGVNHRLAHPYAKGNPERPSFRDTGLYEANFAAWVE